MTDVSFHKARLLAKKWGISLTGHQKNWLRLHCEARPHVPINLLVSGFMASEAAR